MAAQQKVSVVWELLDLPREGMAARVVVDVDSPIRPFGAPLMPPKSAPSGDDAPLDDEALAPRGHRLPKG